MNKMRIAVLGMMLGLVMLAAPRASAEDARGAGRDASEKMGDAVVRFRIVHNISMARGGQSDNDRERKSEGMCTIISAEGLAIAPLSTVDPAASYGKMFRSRFGPDSKFETKIKELKLIMADGSEVAAVVVLRDSDLDIAFLRPKDKPAKAMTFIDLGKSEAPKILDSAFVITRLGKIGKHAPSAMTGEIQAIVSKPRTFYIPSAELVSSGLGVPVFGVSGKPFGILSMKSAAEGADDDDESENQMPIVLPAADVMEMASQAPEKPAAEDIPTDEAPAAAAMSEKAADAPKADAAPKP